MTARMRFTKPGNSVLTISGTWPDDLVEKFVAQGWELVPDRRGRLARWLWGTPAKCRAWYVALFGWMAMSTGVDRAQHRWGWVAFDFLLMCWWAYLLVTDAASKR